MKPEDLMLLVTRTMPFGKYEGRLIADLPGHYLGWFARNGFPKGEIGRSAATDARDRPQRAERAAGTVTGEERLTSCGGDGGEPHQPHPGTRCHRYGCSLPGLAGFTADHCGGTDGARHNAPRLAASGRHCTGLSPTYNQDSGKSVRGQELADTGLPARPDSINAAGRPPRSGSILMPHDPVFLVLGAIAAFCHLDRKAASR